MLGVENLIAKNPDIVSTLSSLFLNVFRKKSDEKDSKDGDYEDVHKEVDDEFMDLENIY